MENIKNFVLRNKYKMLTTVPVVGASLLPVVANAADGETTATSNLTSDMTSALQTAFNGVKGDVQTVISTALPPALVIMGIVLAITIGVKAFKRFAK